MNVPCRPVALVFGVNGQDGSFAAENLLARGYRVYGVGRRERSTWIAPVEGFSYVCQDLRNAAAVGLLVRDLRPNLILHLAAVHGPSGFAIEHLADEMFAVNVLSLQAALAAMAEAKLDGRLVYAGSSHVFGLPTPEYVDLDSPRKPHNLYAVTKIAGADVIGLYRRQYGLSASVLYYFNHESPRRPEAYFVPRLVTGLRATLRNPRHVFKLAALDFHCDWGCAREFMDMTIMAALQCPGSDYVVATGRSMSGRELAQSLFSGFGLDYRNHIEVDGGDGASHPFFVSTDALLRDLNRAPNRSILDVCRDMLVDFEEKAA